MKVFYNALLVHTLINIYVFWRGWQVLPSRKLYRAGYIGFFVIELLVYLVGIIFSTDLPHQTVLRPIMLIGTSWAIFMLYMTILLLAYDVLRFLGRKTKNKKIAALKNLNDNATRIQVYAIFIFVVIGIMVIGSYRFRHPKVTEMNVVVHKESPNVKNLRIVMASDLHLGYLIDRDILRMYVDKIMEQKPDMILLAGDIVDYDLLPLQEQKMGEELKRLKAPYGVFATSGNHEYRVAPPQAIKWLMEDAGLTVLRDKAVKIADSFYLVGREDDIYFFRKSLKQIMKEGSIDKTLPVIAMSHEPNNLAEEQENGVDIAFYGHTHNGQIFPYNLVLKFVYEVPYGYQKKGDMNAYVSSGLGLSGPLYRIGTNSEIVVMDVQFQ
ncbi:putative MPP superfamily phosphohydrolase [Dysgonomonas sp. PH5-45]|uniref:metallophosphoesterase n=1 Tax=unclassified Dysgonomonas TaxID=2630389 RepID=UPI002473F7A7|nr:MULTISPECIES: metallophosphoesterase [unclassified Dysgonomonas]MDH6355905.1 putative MPP superfamily phosphohydrolase [Dysgonomonas sp. PH5-45]MDH6388787.1 putative MPP superfamily phosphohydrolase [Dysgonomonas sp. PH5-37]